jgi:hypothetical protein
MSKATVPIATQLETAVGSLPGWTPLDELLALFNLACGSAAVGGDIVEIGSWCGRSATALAIAARLTGDSRVHCVDLFPTRDDWHENADGTYSLRIATGEGIVDAFRRHTLWREPFERDVAPFYDEHHSPLDVLQAGLARNGLTEIVSLHRGTSAVLARRLGGGLRCRLAFIDGDHDYEAVREDIRNVERFLVRGAWICFDDAFTCYEGVDRAIHELVLDNPAYDVRQQLTRKLFVARRAVDGGP